MTPTRPLSPSQVTTYLDCAERWWFDRIAGEQPPTGALALGKVVHAGIAAGLSGDKNADEVFADAWRADVQRAELRADEDAGALEAKGLQLVALFMKEAAPGLGAVAAIEEPCAGAIGTAHAHGVIDIRTAAGEIIDIKTAAKKPEGISSREALQLTTYGLLKKCRTVRVVTLTKTKEPALYSNAFTLTPSHTQYTASMFSLVGEAITLCGRRN